MNKQVNLSTIPSFEEAVAFHGHACPGLAMGYRVAIAAMSRLQVTRAEDEDLVAIVENDACSVDAVQLVCGCTFGKGNLIFRDHGKQAYTFFNRTTKQGFRIYIEPPTMDNPHKNETERFSPDDERHQLIDSMLHLPEEDLLHITETQEPAPAKARIHAAVRCDVCGERIMETRAVQADGKTLCVPCHVSL